MVTWKEHMKKLRKDYEFKTKIIPDPKGWRTWSCTYMGNGKCRIVYMKPKRRK